MTDFTGRINSDNVRNIREQISRKKSSHPFLATENMAKQVLTDYDTFPYSRWYRGVPNESKPIVAEREAGWRERRETCYQLIQPVTESSYPNHCFEGPCSTVYPCYPKYMQKFSDRDAMNVLLNKSCIVQYR
jgi:hypothetical protein